MPVALIIGNSDGIGLALTQLLLSEGWRVAGISRSPSAVEASGYDHHVIDVCNTDYAERLTQLTRQLTPIDVCVYCVGIGEFLDLETMTHERRVFDANLLGAVITAQVLIPSMLSVGRGHFIGLSSQADALIDPQAPSYAASKAGLSSYLEALALACRPRGVHVTNLRFGFVDTKMAKASVRPFMLSRTEAARLVRRCIDRRPARATFPKRMAVLLWFVRLTSSLMRTLAG